MFEVSDLLFLGHILLLRIIAHYVAAQGRMVQTSSSILYTWKNTGREKRRPYPSQLPDATAMEYGIRFRVRSTFRALLRC